ncbi:hypothetical protein GGR54DRAFT_153202 [Hypoxylon sp. NC1633]|nr:hypothetical protein GGR54DRAFT_153202 [Hypoxylon sp. NC1633]
MDGAVEEAIQLMTLLSQQDIQKAFFAALKSISPAISADDIASIAAAWRSSQIQMELDSARSHPETNPPPPPRIKYYEVVGITPEGVENIRPVYENPEIPKFPAGIGERILAEVIVEKYLPDGEVKKQLLAMNPKKFFAEIDKLTKAAERVGIPGDAEAHVNDAIKVALTRLAVKRATVNGVWQSALLTGVFNIKDLYDGHFKQYLTKVGVSGLFGGTAGGLSTIIKHPFFAKSAVLSLIVGSVFNTFNLASTGDWERFGKNRGSDIISTVASSVGGGAMAGLVGGPWGILAGAACGIAGAFAGQQAASVLPGIRGETKIEIQKMYTGIKDHLSRSGVDLDPSLSPKEVVQMFKTNNLENGILLLPVRMTDVHSKNVNEPRNMLLTMQNDSPERSTEPPKALRGAAQK